MPGELNGPMGVAEGYNGVTQGSAGTFNAEKLRGSSTDVATEKDKMSSMFGPSGGTGGVIDAGTIAAIKAIMPALALQKKQAQPADGITAKTTPSTGTQGSQHKMMGQQQNSSMPRSPGGPGVSAVGQNDGMQNLAMIIKHLLGGGGQ